MSQGPKAMCGRFTLTYPDIDAVADALSAERPRGADQRYRPRYNAAPSDVCWIVCAQHEPQAASSRLELVEATWGYPVAGREGPGIVNARSETVHQRPSFADAFASQRCAVPVDGFFEWTGPKSDRRPLWFHRSDAGLFVLAGIYRDVVTPQTGEVVRHFAILTTDANALVAPHHDRMPVVLPVEATQRWLRTTEARGEAARADVEHLMKPAPDDALVVDPVSKRINDPKNDDPSCLQPPRDAGEQQTLF